jgi:hypothetical protein
LHIINILVKIKLAEMAFIAYASNAAIKSKEAELWQEMLFIAKNAIEQ